MCKQNQAYKVAQAEGLEDEPGKTNYVFQPTSSADVQSDKAAHLEVVRQVCTCQEHQLCQRLAELHILSYHGCMCNIAMLTACHECSCKPKSRNALALLITLCQLKCIASQGDWIGFRSAVAEDKFLQSRRHGKQKLAFFNSNFGTWEQWEIVAGEPRQAWNVVRMGLRNRRLPQVHVLLLRYMRIFHSCDVCLYSMKLSRSL